MKNKRERQPTAEAVVDLDKTETEVDVPVAPSPDVQPAPVANPRLLDIDKAALDLAKERRKTALAEAKTALAQNDNAELAYKYVILQLYMKYGLTDADAISEAGEILKGGALPKPQGVPVR